MSIKPGHFPNQQNAIALLQYIIKTRDNRVDLDARGADGLTLSDHCLAHHYTEAYELLVQAKKLLGERKENKDKAEAYVILLQDAIVNPNGELFTRNLNAAMKIPEFDVNRKIAGRTLLDYAIAARNPAMCQLLINAGADVNLASNGSTPIRSILNIIFTDFNTSTATSYGFKGPLRDILSAIINGAPGHRGADLREIFTHIGPKRAPYSMLAELATSFKFSDLNITRPDIIDNWKKVRDIILNAHRFDLERVMDIYGYSLRLEGLTQGITTEEALASYNEFLTIPEVRDELNDLMNLTLNTKGIDYTQRLGKDRSVDMMTQISIDLRGMIEPLDMKLASDNLRNDQVTAIPLLTNVHKRGDHAQSCLIYGDYYIHINCGATLDPRGPRGITVYQIGDKKSFLEEVPKLINSHKDSLDDAYLIGELLRKGQLKEVCNVKVPIQTVGNCTWKSTEALLRAIIFINVFKNVKSQFPDDNDFCFHIAKLVSQKWQDLFITHDRNRGVTQSRAFMQNIPKGIMADMESKAAEEQKKNREKDKYWLNMHKQPYHGSGPGQDIHGAGPDVGQQRAFGDVKQNLEKKVALEALSLTLPKEKLQNIMTTRFGFDEGEVKALFEAINAAEHEVAKKDNPAFINTLMRLNAMSITPLIDDDNNINIQFEDADAKKSFMKQYELEPSRARRT